MDLFTKFFTICELYEFCEKIFFSQLYKHVYGPNVCLHLFYSYIFYFPKANPFYFVIHKCLVKFAMGHLFINTFAKF